MTFSSFRIQSTFNGLLQQLVCVQIIFLLVSHKTEMKKKNGQRAYLPVFKDTSIQTSFRPVLPVSSRWRKSEWFLSCSSVTDTSGDSTRECGKARPIGFIAPVFRWLLHEGVPWMQSQTYLISVTISYKTMVSNCYGTSLFYLQQIGLYVYTRLNGELEPEGMSSLLFLFYL